MLLIHRALPRPATWMVWLLLAFAVTARAGRLPIRQYTTADGLPHDRVTRIVADSKGFLWFCTANGLSRFDGTRFVNYLPPGTQVRDVAEGPDGVYWVGIWRGGIVRLDGLARDPAALIRPVEGDYPHTVRRLVFDRQGRLWIGTAAGLYRIDDPERPEVRAVELQGATPNIWDVLIDRRERVWVATDASGLLTLLPSGEVVSREPVPGQLLSVQSLLESRDGRIWAGHDAGVMLLDPRASDRETRYGPDVVGKGPVFHLFQSTDGTIWISRFGGGLSRYDGNGFEAFTEGRDIPSRLVQALTEDVSGNLWVGTKDAGAMRLPPVGFTAYDEDHGLAYSGYGSLLEDRSGQIVVAAGHALFRYGARRFVEIRPAVLRGMDTGKQSDTPFLLQDSRDRWWLGTQRGLYRYAAQPVSALSHALPEAVFTTREGLPGDRVSALFEDSRGDVWIGVEDPHGLARWDRASDTLRRYSSEDGLPASAPRSFAEDSAGNLWIGFDRGLTRYRSGQFSTFGESEGLTANFHVYGLLVDHQGRLWITSVGAGVNRVDDPTSAQPAFVDYSDRIGERFVWSAVEDRWGRIYFGTLNGIVRLEPDTGRSRRFTTDDGLSSNEMAYALRDRDGALWFTSVEGVSHLEPQAEPPEGVHPPSVRVTGVRIAGEPHPVAELGESSIAGIRIQPYRGRVEIEFGGIDFDPGRPVRYQYRLEGSGDWSVPSAQRTVHYASLSPGSYRFRVRALDAGGTASVESATVAFRVLAPLWQRWWFLLAMGLSAVAVIYSVHRFRLARMLELERVRTRIATDLHDDVGSSLSQIAILSELVQRDLDEHDTGVRQPLSKIAGVSRELVDSMSDIVWAINPKRDNLDDVVHRMRRFANDTLGARDIELDFRAAVDDGRLHLGPELRRELYLVFKESLHNVVKHADCARVEIEIGTAGGQLSLIVCDDGKGFEREREVEGHGLASMARRAERLGGSLRVERSSAGGTSVTLEIPLGRRRR